MQTLLSAPIPPNLKKIFEKFDFLKNFWYNKYIKEKQKTSIKRKKEVLIMENKITKKNRSEALIAMIDAGALDTITDYNADITAESMRELGGCRLF